MRRDRSPPQMREAIVVLSDHKKPFGGLSLHAAIADGHLPNSPCSYHILHLCVLSNTWRSFSSEQDTSVWVIQRLKPSTSPSPSRTRS